MVVELFEGADRQVDVVLLEAEQARRVVHQHVRVEHEQLGDADLLLAAGFFLDQGGGGGRGFGQLAADVVCAAGTVIGF